MRGCGANGDLGNATHCANKRLAFKLLILEKSAFRRHDCAVSSRGMKAIGPEHSARITASAKFVAASCLVFALFVGVLSVSAQQLPVRTYTTADEERKHQ